MAQLKESPAGSKILAFVTAVNSGGEVTDEWVKQLHAPRLVEKAGIAHLKSMIKQIYEMDGKILIYEAKRTDVFEYKLKVKGVGWFDMVFIFEENEPYRIIGITSDSSDSGSKQADPIFPTN